MSNKRRTPDTKELSLWRRMMQGVSPLHKTPQSDCEMPRKKTLPQSDKTRRTPDKSYIPVETVQTPTNAGLDRRTDDKLRKGKMPIEATLDLHGMTQSVAHQRLEQFIMSAHLSGKRCVLVITGKGSRQSHEGYILSERSEKGVLKSRLPDWLNQAPLSDIVLKYVHAHQKHGGGGAFYVYLRNKNKIY